MMEQMSSEEINLFEFQTYRIQKETVLSAWACNVYRTLFSRLATVNRHSQHHGTSLYKQNVVSRDSPLILPVGQYSQGSVQKRNFDWGFGRSAKYLRGVNEGPLVSIEQNRVPQVAVPLDKVVPAVPYEVGPLVPQKSENHGPLVDRSVRSRDIAQGASF